MSKAIELREGLNRYTKLDALIQSRMRSRKGRKIRSQDTIVYEILEACHSPAVEHWIMIKARVGYQSFVKHMGDLLSEGKVKYLQGPQDDDRGRRSTTYYTLTEEGLQLLEQMRKRKESNV